MCARLSQAVPASSTGLTSRNDFISIRVNIEGVMQLQIAVQLEGRHTADAHAIWVDPRLTLSDSWGSAPDSHGFQVLTCAWRQRKFVCVWL